MISEDLQGGLSGENKMKIARFRAHLKAALDHAAKELGEYRKVILPPEGC